MDKQFTKLTKNEVSLIVDHLNKEAETKVIAYEIFINKPVVYYSDLLLSIDKYHWIRRKRNTCLRFAQSSLEVAKKNPDLESFIAKYGLEANDFINVAGSVPIFLNDILVGAVTVTGMTPEEDHKIATSAISYALSHE